MTSRSAVGALGAALVVSLLLAGCAKDEPVGVADPVPAVTPTPTATPQQTQETGDVQPVQVYGGDCAAVLPTTDLVAAAGQPLTPRGVDRGQPRSFADDFAVRQVGGLECAWYGGTALGAVIITVVPINAVPARAAEPCRVGEPGYEWGEFVCDLELTTDGLHLSGRASFMGGTLATATTRAAAVSDLFESNAAAAEPVLLPLPADDSWGNPLDCRILQPLLANPAILGGSPQPLLGGSGGTDVYFSPANVYLTGLGAEPARLQCSIYSDTEITAAQQADGKIPRLDFSALGGGAWVKDIIAARPDASPISISGVDSAILVNDVDYGAWIAAFDGPNYISVRTMGDYRHYLEPTALVIEAFNDEG